MVFIFAIGFASVVLDQVFKSLGLLLLIVGKKTHDVQVLEPSLKTDKLDNVKQLLTVSVKFQHEEWCQSNNIIDEATFRILGEDFGQVSDWGAQRFLRVHEICEEAQHHVNKEHALHDHRELRVIFSESSEVDVYKTTLNPKDINEVLYDSVWHAPMIDNHSLAQFFRVEHLEVVGLPAALLAQSVTLRV